MSIRISLQHGTTTLASARSELVIFIRRPSALLGHIMPLPLEVELVRAVRQCRTCQWFWGGIPPYGHFPLYDWKEEFPEQIRNQRQTTNLVVHEPALRGSCVGTGQVDPGIMHGCRKAPIMTIGINPNMTAYFPSSKGARWAYPAFSSDASYAYYYRHHNVYQESLDLDLIESRIIRGTELKARADGWLSGTRRSADHRWVELEIIYQDESEPTIVEVAWTPETRFVVLVEADPQPDRQGPPRFRKGATIGGKIAELETSDTQIFENSAEYYQRFVYVLERFKELVGGPLATADLSISEDVAQHDMVACASPGWSSQYDIPRDRIAANCVSHHGYLVSQVIQTRPSVIVVVGGSAMEMFAQPFGRFIDGLNYATEADPNENGRPIPVEIYHLFKETVEREVFLNIQVDGYELRTRIVVCPHFSYADNFLQQSRFSAEAWSAFQTDFSTDAATLADAGRVRPNTWNDIVPIRVDGDDDPIKEQISSAGWSVILAYHYDPIEMLADVLRQELDAGRLAYDPAVKRLERAAGSCRFCVNTEWSFTEGCAYGKDSEDPPAPDELERVVRTVLEPAGAAAGSSE